MNEKSLKRTGFTVRELTLAAMFSALTAVCSWISVPVTIPFTMQTFAIFCALGILGGRLGLFSVLAYIAAGAVGVPVFAGFTGGIGILFGNTGGYFTGFVLGAAAYWLITSVWGESLPVKAAGMISAMIVYYLFGTVWFTAVYAGESGKIGFLSALGICVFPFVIPDLIKMALALAVSEKFGKYAVRIRQ